MRTLLLCLLAAVVGATAGCSKKKKPAQKSDTPETLPAGSDGQAHGDSDLKRPGLEAVRLPGEMLPAPWLEGATRVIAIQAGIGPVIVAGGNGWLRWFDKEGTRLGERKTEGAAQVLEALDVNGDGVHEAVAIGRGLGTDAADSPISLEVVYLVTGDKGELAKKPRVERIVLPETPRAQVVAVAAVPGGKDQLWAASFVNKYEVEVARHERGSDGTWTTAESRGRHRVVGDLSVMPDGTPIIARFYGDSADEDGGVFALPAEGEPIELPSTRGARAVLAMPGPEFQLAMADGWHKEYGKRAQGLITVIAKAEQGYTQVASVEVRGNYGFSQLRLSYVHKDPGPELLASGNGNAVVMLPSRPDLLFELAGAEAFDAFPVQLLDDGRMEVVIAGPTPAIWTPR